MTAGHPRAGQENARLTETSEEPASQPARHTPEGRTGPANSTETGQPASSPLSCDIEDSVTHVADLLRGICIVNLRPAESPVCPFRWLQSGNS